MTSAGESQALGPLKDFEAGGDTMEEVLSEDSPRRGSNQRGPPRKEAQLGGRCREAGIEMRALTGLVAGQHGGAGSSVRARWGSCPVSGGGLWVPLPQLPDLLSQTSTQQLECACNP